MEKKIISTDVGERINDTKKEIAQLSEELERLIKSNAGLSNINFERGQSNEEAIIIKSSQIKDDGTSNKVFHENVDEANKKLSAMGKTVIPPEVYSVKLKKKPELICNKKYMTHDKESTKEFMRQQREKREEQRKKIDSKNKIDLEVKKQKLLELQKKSMALVQRNIQLKRERSKSRERWEQIRIDKSSAPSNSGISLAKKPSSDYLSSKKTTSDVLSKKPVKLQNRSIANIKKKNSFTNKNDQSSVNSSPKLKPLISLSENKGTNADVLKNTNKSEANFNQAANKIQAFYRGYRSRKQLEERKQELKYHLKEHPIKESKETQTSTEKQIKFPAWIQPPTIDPYPCNFINTIKKKLQLVVNSPVRSKDIGIQSSLLESRSNTQKNEKTKKRRLTNENLKADKKGESDSNPQKVTNLDADALQHFALINFREKYSLNNKGNFRSDSESDTSKNIPEISTESGLVSDEKLILVSERSDRVLSINTDKIKNFTLRKPMDEDFSDKQGNISKRSYTFNFSGEHITKHADISSEKIQTEVSCSKNYIRSPRDSILSFIISDATKNPSVTSQRNKQKSEWTSNEEIKTEKSNHSYSREKENSRRRLIFNQKESITSRRSTYDDEKDFETNFKNLNSYKHNIILPSNRSSDSLKTSPVERFSGDNQNSSHLSSHSSRHSIKRNSSSKKIEESLGKQVTQLKSPSLESLSKAINENTNKEINSDSSEVIFTSSGISTNSTNSTKFSNPNFLNIPLEVKNKIDHPEVEIKSLLNTLTSGKVTEIVYDGVEKELNITTNNKNKEFEATELEKQKDFSENIELKKLGNTTKANEVNSQVVKDFKSRIVQSKIDTNEIHLKFEAEVHLLNDFNESLKQFMAVEKAFESLKNKNECSFRNSSKTSSALILSGDSKISSNLSKPIGSTINTSRGSELDESYITENSLLKPQLKSNNNLEMSSMLKSSLGNESFSLSENSPNNLAGLSIKMFEQFIKDEDIRIENLRTIIKIREQALLDRTKGELAWLEIQRKHLKETGNLHKASLVKKKQRGILLKHQQERREMQRLKQLQKMKSNERKTILNEQKNLIKAKLTSEKLISELKIQTPRKQRPSGPLKVLKASESHSEASLSRKASDTEEIFSITSRSQSIKLSEIDSGREFVFKQDKMDIKNIGDSEDIDHMEQALLERQASLMKRRKAVEDLLKRHKKLLEEEEKIKELEMQANAIIMQLPSKSITTRKPRIQIHSKKINQNVISFSENKQSGDILSSQKKSNENASQRKDKNQISINTNSSQIENSFNNFYHNTEATINEMKIKQNEKDEIESTISIFKTEYLEDFESEKHVFDTESNENNISSISELIEDFTQIEQGISLFSKQFNETALDTSASLEKIGNSSQLSLLDNLKNTMNILSASKEDSVDSHKNLKTATFSHSHTDNEVEEKVLGIHDFQPSSKFSVSFSQPEKKILEEISLIKKSGEIVITENIFLELSKNNEKSKKSNNGIIESESLKISDEKELLEVLSLSEVIPEIYVNTLKQHNVSTDQIQFSEKTTISDKSIHFKSKIEDEENNRAQMIPSQSSEVISLAEIDTPVLKQENEKNINKIIFGSDISEIGNLIVSEYGEKEFNSTDSKSSNEKESVSTEIVGEFDEYSEVEKNSEESEGITSIESVPQIIFEKNSSKDIISSDNELSLIETRIEDKMSKPLIDPKVSPKNKVPLHEDIKNEMVKFKTTENLSLSSNDYNQDFHSLDKEETFQDISSFENNSGIYGSEIKNDETSKDYDIHELNLNKGNFELKSEEENFSANQNLNLSVADGNLGNKSKNTLIDNVLQESIENGINKNSHSIESSLIEVINIQEEMAEESQIEENQEVIVSDEFENNYTSIEEEKSIRDDSSSNSYTDDFEDDKDENSLIQEPSHKLILDSTLKTEENKNVSEIDQHDVLMVKIELTMDTTSTEAKIVIVKDDLNKISDHDKIQEIDSFTQENDRLKSPIQQRASQILENKIGSQKCPIDGNTRDRDYYVTAYEDITPANSPESASPVKSNQLASLSTFNNEAEELLKKQLAIELEIKHLEQQQKEQLPFVYIREIPNKPPPPYTPPSTQNNITILPGTVEDLKEICRYSAEVLYNAYLSNKMHAVTFSETHLKTINQTKCTKECCLFIFDLCREIAENHYKRYQSKTLPFWLKLPEESCLILGKPFTCHQLENHIHMKVKEMLGFEKKRIKENSIVRWAKKKDHVDEILVLESQAEEQEWLNYDNDELMVKNEVTDAIFDILLRDTVNIFNNIFS
ncbi:centrosome-associated protein 350-like [Harmonia axyridis]|uniref:centrosome-associated protein 350-like n=1 Tax=Harmonia axyridis TaxID=115357 RepID=UPI001E2778EF|nr:centrosome-associated protein 350-like [Harmonia axyridis]